MAIEAQRTLVKSVPELWATLSEAAQLGPLLDGAFGEIRITRLEPESLIAWEGELASGEVELAASGFGTKVRLTAQLPEPEPEPDPAPAPAPSGGRLRRLFGRLRRAEEPPPPPEPPPPAEPRPPRLEPEVAERALGNLLDEVGAARHRPFTR